jgi:radical SAM superfamily enzyme YgiQ (UPF0313 family)
MAQVVLVYPPIVFGRKEHLGLPPLGVLYIATFLRKKGIDVRLIDASIQGHSLEKLVQEILKEEPLMVGFSAMTIQIGGVLELTAELKKRKPSLKIIVGGHHVNATRAELLQFTENIDFLFYGEGEKEVYRLVRALEDGTSLADIRGLIYKKEGQVIINDPPLTLENLDELPFPDLDLLDIKQYDIYYAKSLPLTSILASRGCPYQCIYCSASLVHGKRFRLRSPANVVEEIQEDYQKYRIRQFVIKDSTFTADKQWVYDVCSEIQKKGLKIHWSCNTRADLLDEALLKAMKRSGCRFISFGIESGSQKILNALKKGMTTDHIRKAVALCKKVGIQTIGNFMIGNPTETEEDARQTIQFIKELDLDLAFTFLTIAYPGTEIYSWAQHHHALSDRYWYMKEKKQAFAGGWEINGSLELEGFPKERTIAMVKKANKSFYFRPSFILKRISNIRGIWDLKRNLTSFVKLLRKG